MVPTINIPKFFKRGGEFDWGLFFQVITISILIVLGTAFAGGFTYKVVRWMVRKPATVVYKYQDALTQAQNEYIKDCRNNSHEGNPGVPDVHVNPWTCLYAK